MDKEIQVLLGIRRRRADKIASNYRAAMKKLKTAQAAQMAAEAEVERIVENVKVRQAALQKKVLANPFCAATMSAWHATLRGFEDEIAQAQDEVRKLQREIQYRQRKSDEIQEEHRLAQMAIEKLEMLQKELSESSLTT